MLTFEQKLALIESFPELQRKNVSLGRVNFHYEDSVHDKKIVAYHLHPNGNGFVYAALVPGADVDEKGFVNIREWEEAPLRELIAASIASLSGGKPVDAAKTEADRTAEESDVPAQIWRGPDNQTLRLTFENELWYVFAGEAIESAFETYEEAVDYMREEGFSRQ
ncbi:hypothetical protein MO973_33375 [Paenibacillus sp. TRM 82003]|nr:hypothetical protein [Paenibacillus sp. TRM 82003]